jgi:UDP-N-acetylmuramoyl-tripeptide--D-alanyl-D-alanine ligase
LTIPNDSAEWCGISSALLCEPPQPLGDMNRVDPFFGYSLLLRTIVFVIVPAFALWQFVRLRRALHVFQQEGYKRKRFLQWCLANRDRALFLRAERVKKPLVMTGRAWRILVVAVLLTLVLLLVPAALVHLWVGTPLDLITWVLSTFVVGIGLPILLVAADLVLAPVQAAINAVFRSRAQATLRTVDPLVIGVTGSFGKTSVKMAIADLIGPAGTAFPTPGSYNTPMGVCRAINEGLQDNHQFFIVEMGAYKEGDVAELCSFVRPRIGVLTAIGPAHLERFGSMSAIRRAKYEIVSGLLSDGAAVMNVDDPEVRDLADSTTSVEVIRYGLDPSGVPRITATDVETSVHGTHFTLRDIRDTAEVRAQTTLLGRHALGHVLAAVAVARVVGRELDELVDPISRLQAPDHRLKILTGTGGVIVIDDAFNSNPDGAAAALEVLEAMPARRKVVVTPGMIELGPLQREANETLGQQAATTADLLIVVAKVNREAIVTGAARATPSSAEVITVDSLAEATGALNKRLRSGDVVLFENDLPDQYEN